MNTYFAFIDETGSYRKERDDAFIQRFPYYLKACLLISASSWKALSNFRKQICQEYDIGVLNELKWNHLWKLRKRDDEGVNISYGPQEEFLKNIPFSVSEKYAKKFLSSLPDYDPMVICTITPNCVFFDKVDEIKLELMHFQDIMQRLEMEMSDRKGDNLAILFADQMSERRQERDLKEYYYELFHGGDLIKEYAHLMDSLSFEHSHQCCGLQMADFIAGSISGFLRGYDFSQTMFALRVYAKIRKGRYDLPFGYGIIDVPKRSVSRGHLEEKFNIVLSAY